MVGVGRDYERHDGRKRTMPEDELTVLHLVVQSLSMDGFSLRKLGWEDTHGWNFASSPYWNLKEFKIVRV